MATDFYIAFKHKKQEEIKIFYQENWPKVRHVLTKLGANEEVAKDYMQSSMIALFSNIRNGKYIPNPNVKLSSYFIQICKNQYKDLLKSVHHRQTKSIDTVEKETFLDKDKLAHQKLSQIERQNLLHRYINMLDVKCKDILKAFYWENASLSDIAESNDLTEASAKTVKYRCMKKLKESMSHININEV